MKNNLCMTDLVSRKIKYSWSFLQEKAKFRMMKQEGSDKKNSYWDNLWGKQKDYQSSGTRM